MNFTNLLERLSIIGASFERIEHSQIKVPHIAASNVLLFQYVGKSILGVPYIRPSDNVNASIRFYFNKDVLYDKPTEIQGFAVKFNSVGGIFITDSLGYGLSNHVIDGFSEIRIEDFHKVFALQFDAFMWKRNEELSIPFPPRHTYNLTKTN